MRQYETSLRPRMNQYKQAAEQLANFGNQTAWLAHREADGLVEIHQDWSDLGFVRCLRCSVSSRWRRDRTAVHGVPSRTALHGVRGGESKLLQAGDVVTVPAGVPHQFLVPAGQQITFVTMKIAKP